jgi:hypothetical protein
MKKPYDYFFTLMESGLNLGARAAKDRRKVFSIKFSMVVLVREFLGNRHLSALCCPLLPSGLIWAYFFPDLKQLYLIRGDRP